MQADRASGPASDEMFKYVKTILNHSYELLCFYDALCVRYIMNHTALCPERRAAHPSVLPCFMVN